MKKLPALFLALSLFACSSYETAPPIQLDYGNLGKINLDVARIDVVDQTTPSSSAMQPTIADAVKRWAADRLQATGSSGQATVVIKEADFKRESLKTETGVESWFTRQQSTKFTSRVAVGIEAHGGNSYAAASAEASRYVTLPEEPSPLEKQQAYRQLLDGLMTDFDRNIEAAIRTHMQRFTAGPGGTSRF